MQAALGAALLLWWSPPESCGRDDSGRTDRAGSALVQNEAARPQAAPKTATAPAGDPGPNPYAVMSDPQIRAAARRAIDLGLRYIARRQTQTDGSFTLTADEVQADHRAPYAVTALAALAYMADGNSETRGPYSRQLKRAIDYLINKATFDADGREAYLTADGDNLSRTHGHGYATLALAEVLGMGGIADGPKRVDRIRKTLAAAVRKIESTQGELGGWYYTPTRSEDHEGSVTITLVQALRAARNAGIGVDVQVIRKAVEYVRKSQKMDPAARDHGAFRYRIQSGETTLALTAAAVSTLNATGDYDSVAIDAGIRYIQSQLKDRAAHGFNARTDSGFPSYELLYLAQAFRQYRDPELFTSWYRSEVPRIVKRQEVRVLDNQEEEGSWFDPYSRILGTSIAIIVLRLEDSYLPILQR